MYSTIFTEVTQKQTFHSVKCEVRGNQPASARFIRLASPVSWFLVNSALKILTIRQPDAKTSEQAESLVTLAICKGYIPCSKRLYRLFLAFREAACGKKIHKWKRSSELTDRRLGLKLLHNKGQSAENNKHIRSHTWDEYPDIFRST